MTVTVSKANDSRISTQDIYALQAQITALATASATAGFQQNSEGQSLNSLQVQLVEALLNNGKLDPALVISTMSVNVLVDPVAGPLVASLVALIAANPLLDNSGALTTQLAVYREQVVRTAINSGGRYAISAASILSKMSIGNA